MIEKQPRVLIVEDEEGIRRFLRQKLSGEGYRCLEASSAEEALDEVKRIPIDLVLLDIKLPGKSGIELLSEIKAIFPDVAVLMVTATVDADIVIKCMKQGAYDYLIKPFNWDEVVFSIKRALEKRRLELKNQDYQWYLEQRVEEQAKKVRASFFNAITALAYALEAKDRYTSGHSQRVTRIAIAIAKKIDLSQQSIEKVRLSGLIHDIGKIGVKESILNKPDKLTDEEFQHIKYHPGIAERILSPVIEDLEILSMVKHHHERYDGSGYPDALSGEHIPLGARILTLADSYDAMTSERPYRKAMSVESACAEIERCKGSQFDPEVAEIFLRICTDE